jgi:hypothetical protein
MSIWVLNFALFYSALYQLQDKLPIHLYILFGAVLHFNEFV